MSDETEKGCDFVLTRRDAGADAFVEEVGAKGSKLEHGFDAGGGFVVSVGVEGIQAIWTVHDGECIVVGTLVVVEVKRNEDGWMADLLSK